MAVCTFFGHRNITKDIEPILYSTLVDLIENKNVNVFYVGNQGGFDYIVRKNLKILKVDYPHIDYAVVLAYMPSIKDKCVYYGCDDTIYPEEMEKIHPKYAIIERNKWMINVSEYVVTYVKYSSGGAAQFKSLAENMGRTVINLADL